MRTIVFAYARMNPPTAGHDLLVSKVLSTAVKLNCDHTIVLSHTQDKKNPLDPHFKLRYCRRFWPCAMFKVATRDEPSLMHHIKRLSLEYDKIVVVCGSDRVDEYTRLINKYNRVDYTFNVIEVVSSGQRDADSQLVTGVSASKARAAAELSDFVKFFSMMPNMVEMELAMSLYNDVRNNLLQFERGRVNKSSSRNRKSGHVERKNSAESNKRSEA